MNSKDIPASSMNNIRKIPPLAAKMSITNPPTSSKHLERSTVNQPQQTLTFTKKTSQVSLPHEIDRRKSNQNVNRSPGEMYESSVQPLPQSNRAHFKSNTCAEVSITNDLLQILKDQNRNLKQQNNFLLTKIRQLSEGQKSLKETVAEYQGIINELTLQNRQLKEENLELTQIASRKVNQFGHRLAQLMTESEDSLPINNYKQTDINYKYVANINSPYSVENHQQFNTVPGAHTYSLPPVPPKMTKADSSTEPNDSQMEELNNQFEALIYSLRLEKKLQKRKNIRKKLLELTYRMQQLKGERQ